MLNRILITGPTPPSAGVNAPTWSKITVGGIKQRAEMKEEEADGAISTWRCQSLLKGARVRARKKKKNEKTSQQLESSSCWDLKRS